MGKTLRTLIARNAESFSFLYQETIDSFENVSFFDPEHDVPCLDDVALLYLPGGYPEKHVEALVKNEACRKAIKDFAERGGRIQAECGGMMYLCRSIVTDEGEWPMCGVFPYDITARKADRKLSLGYRRFVLDGKEYRGHEFHYTQFLRGEGQEASGERIASAAQVYDAKGNPVETPIMKYKNVLASYTHLGPTPCPSRAGGEIGHLIQQEATAAEVTSRMRHPILSSRTEGEVDYPIQQKVAAFELPSRTREEVSYPIQQEHAAFELPSRTGGVGGGLHPVMFAGTGSDVGKSIIAAAFCRIFKQDGYRPAPFKAQNMALNSYATPEGLEIGRAQAVQAEAAGIPCHTDMNPLLLKPQSDHTSQVVLNGKPIGNKDAYDYWKKGNHHSQFSALNSQFRKEVCAAFDRLSAKYNPIVMEGAGSISEINLRDTDLVNLPMARHANADVILVADIDRGGVFASVYGSIALQTEEDRKRIKGIIINKFRGDLRLFDEGRKMLEDICGIPVLGVVPYYKDISIEEEDSVALAQKSFELQQGKVNVAVVMLKHLSNYTDFDALEHDSRVHLFYTNNTADLQKADIIIVPGSKSTLSDLYELRRNGCAQAILKAHRRGATILGICGGYQMMGIEVLDPNHTEGDMERLPGLGLLPTTTTMSGEKITRQVSADLSPLNANLKSLISQHSSLNPLRGYEIHMGETHPFGDAKASPLLQLSDGRQDGYIVDEHCMGTYVHGILDNSAFVDFLLTPFAEKLSQTAETFDYAAFKEEQYDKLAEHVRQHVDMQRLYQILSTDD